MIKNYKDITVDISSSLAKLRKEIPEVMKGFETIAQAATKMAPLAKKPKN